MSEQVIADFVARFVVDDDPNPDPVSGRVVLSPKRLVLATGDSKTTVPLSTVFDVSIGYVPPKLSEFFNDTVTLAYERDGERSVAFIEAGSEEVKRFKTLLFKALLNGTTVSVKHPARVGGRVTNQPFQPANLAVRPGELAFVDGPEPFAIELPTVTHFEKIEREVAGETRPVISVRHASDGQAATSEIALQSSRKTNVLGRYVRLEYSEIRAELAAIDVSDEEVETLVAIYSHGDASNVAQVLGKDSSSVTMLLNDLERKGLLTAGDDGLSLSTRGQLVVSRRIEDVNA